MTISMLGAIGELQRPDYGGYVKHGILSGIYAQVREEEQVISLQFIGSQQDVSTRRIKKRKQVDDATAAT